MTTFTRPHSDVRASLRQREYIHRLLRRTEFIGKRESGAESTGRNWQPVFTAIRNAPGIDPKTGQTKWPTANEVVDSLTTVQASALINWLLTQVED